MNKIKALIPLLSIVMICGCAHTPSGVSPLEVKELNVTISFLAPINENYYYYFPIDINGGGTGPVPVFPGSTSGMPWVTGSATHYVQYHQRKYTVYRILSLTPFESEQIGSPLRYTLPSGGNTLAFTIDLNGINAENQSIDVNMIAVDEPFSQMRLLDGLGPRGTDFLNIVITNNITYANQELNIESTGDVLDNNGIRQPPNDRMNALDISNWTIAVGT